MDLDIEPERGSERFDGLDTSHRTAAVDPFDTTLTEQLYNVSCLVVSELIEGASEVVVGAEASARSRRGVADEIQGHAGQIIFDVTPHL